MRARLTESIVQTRLHDAIIIKAAVKLRAKVWLKPEGPSDLQKGAAIT